MQTGGENKTLAIFAFLQLSDLCDLGLDSSQSRPNNDSAL